MKIAIIHLGRKGAGPVYALEMAKALHALGHNVYYYASTSVENRKVVEEQGFHKHFFDTYSSGIEYAWSVISWYKIQRVIDSIKKDAPDVVYSCMNDLWAPFIFPRLKGITRVKTIHDVGIHEGNNSKFNIWWNNTCFKDADKFVILSRKYVPKLVERGIFEEKIAVIPHAGFDYYTKFSSTPVNEVQNPIILFFGRIDQYKGVGVLLKAFPKVLEKHPNAILRIAGNGNLQAEMPLIDRFGGNIDLQNRWIRDEEVSTLVEDTTFVVLPYTHATNVGCLDEQVVEGETGYMCEGSDTSSLADAMIKMLDNLEYTKQMGYKANDYMKKYLTWEASAKIFIDFVKNE